MKKNDKACIEEIVTVEDNFSWNELNCFYRPFAIVLSSINNQYFQTFLMFVSMYVTYVLEDGNQLTYNKADVMLNYYNEELQNLFHSNINEIDIKKVKDIHKKIKKELSENRAVILPCDLYYLPYSQNYKDLHKRHYLIIKGYDSRKQIYYVLDNMQNELGASIQYSDFMLEERIICEMNGGFAEHFDRIWGFGYFWSIDLCNNKDFFAENIRYLKKASMKLMEEDICKNFETKILVDLKDENFAQNIYSYLMRCNIRTLFFNTLINCLSEYSGKEEIFNKIKTLCETISREWDVIKQSIAYKIQNRNNMIEKIEKRAENNREQEKVLFSLIIEYISSITGRIERKKEMKDYIVKNRNQAFLSVTEDTGFITILKDKIYDTWIEKNNAPQILYDVKREEGEFNLKLDIDTAFGSSTMCGIIVYLVDGTKIMYGSLGRLNLGIHVPDNGGDYEYYMEEEVVEDILILGVLFKKNICMFYVEDENGNKRVKAELPLKKSIMQMGVFVKTWEHAECNVKFEIKKNLD